MVLDNHVHSGYAIMSTINTSYIINFQMKWTFQILCIFWIMKHARSQSK